MLAFDGGGDFVGIGDSCEGLWAVVGLGEEAMDGGLEIDEGSEHAALQSLLALLGEEALHRDEPGT